MATYAIGDIHGCYQTLLALLEEIKFQKGIDKLWFVGDLVNGGPDSLAVMRWAYAHRDAIVVVLGNHDIHMLAAASAPEKMRPKDTFQDVLDAPDAEELLNWLRQCPMVHAQDGFLMVHAGLLPQWSVEQALALAHEVEDALRSDHYARFFSEMYGNEPSKWRDDLKGMERMRLTVNAMTRMRILSADNTLEFKYKKTYDAIPKGHRAWFDASPRAMQEATIICGHWSALGLKVRQNLLAIDTGAVWGRTLTAIRLEDRAIFQAQSEMDPARFE